MLGERHRRWPNIKTTPGQYVAFAGISFIRDTLQTRDTTRRCTNVCGWDVADIPCRVSINTTVRVWYRDQMDGGGRDSALLARPTLSVADPEQCYRPFLETKLSEIAQK